MSGKKVKIAVVGVGGMGSGHCKSLPTIEECELTAVVDVNPDQARRVGEECGVPYFTDYRKVLRKKGLADAVVIAAPHYFHPPIAIAAFRAGLHVLSEKPIAVQISQAEKMVAAARASGKVFCVMFQMRTEAHTKKAKELVDTGELGEIRRTMLVSPEYRSQAYYDSGTWRATWGGEGGGVMMNQAPHIMDVFTMLGGMPKRVHGRIATVLHDIEVEDQAEAMLEYENGAAGYFYVATSEMGRRFVEIVGDKGKLRLEGDTLRFWRYSMSVSQFTVVNTEMWGSPKMEEVELKVQPCENGHRVILRNFARAILYGEPLISPGEVGLKGLELANAITLSSYDGKPVDLPINRARFDRLIKRLKATSSFKDDWGDTKAETDPSIKK
jgi:predicted dehydrogenase